MKLKYSVACIISPAFYNIDFDWSDNPKEIIILYENNPCKFKFFKVYNINNYQGRQAKLLRKLFDE